MISSLLYKTPVIKTPVMSMLCNRSTRHLTISLLFLSLGHGLKAQESESPSEPPVAFKVTGTVEGVKQTEIKAETKQQTSLKIESIVPHGSSVSEGDVLVSFERAELEKKIRLSEQDLRLAEIAFEGDLFSHRQAEITAELDRKVAERDWQAAEQTFANYMDVDRERSIESADFSLKQSLATLMNAKEELKQLQQMYSEDDLTEESEEIVLKRAKQAVESAEFRHTSAEIQAKRSKEQEIPRTTEKQKDTFERAKLAHEKAIRDLNDEKEKRRIDLDKKEVALREQREKHEELVQDLERLEIKAKHSGLVVYGELQRGKLADKPPQHRVGSSVNGDQTILTIIDPSALQIRTSIPEANVHRVNAEDQCTAIFTAIPDRSIEAIVASVDSVPFASTQYDCVITIPAGALTKLLRPLMTAEVEFTQPPKLIAMPAKKKSQPVRLKREIATPKIKSVPQVPVAENVNPIEGQQADSE